MPPNEPVKELHSIEDESGSGQRWAIPFGLLGFVILGFYLPRLGLTNAASWAGATIFLMALWWIVQPVPLWVPALLPIVLFPTLSNVPLLQIVYAYFDPVNFLFLGGMLIAACMEQWGLHRRLALNIVAFLGVNPRMIVLGFMLATGFITLWISNTATALLMYPIALAVLKKFEEEHGTQDPTLRRFGAALMLGIAYAASIGGIGTKIGTGPNLIFVKQAATANLPEIDFLTWLKVGLPIVVIYLPLVWLYLVRISVRIPSKPFPGGHEAIHGALRKMGSMTRGEKVALTAFLIAACLWTFRQEIDLGSVRFPGWANLMPWSWKGLLGSALDTLPQPVAKMFMPSSAESMVAIIIGVGLLFIPVHLSPRQMALNLSSARGIGWDMLVLLGGGFALAEGFQKSGLSGAMADGIRQLPAMSPLTGLILICAITTLLSEFASNVATASILLPLVAVASTNMGLHPGPAMFAATMAASFGFMLPAGTPPNAIVFGSGYLKVGQMVRIGLVVDIGGVILIALACRYVAPWALGVGAGQ